MSRGSKIYQRKEEESINKIDLTASKSRKRIFGSPFAVDTDSDDDLCIEVWKSFSQVSESPFRVDR